MSDIPETITELRRRRRTEIYAAIREVLFCHWDPIGVRNFAGPEDEYDSYIAPVYRLLQSEASDKELAEYLSRTASETMGLSVPPGKNHLEEVIKHLRAIDLQIE